MNDWKLSRRAQHSPFVESRKLSSGDIKFTFTDQDNMSLRFSEQSHRPGSKSMQLTSKMTRTKTKTKKFPQRGPRVVVVSEGGDLISGEEKDRAPTTSVDLRDDKK